MKKFGICVIGICLFIVSCTLVILAAGCQTATTNGTTTPTSGTVTLHYIGYPTEECEGFVFSTASKTSHYILAISTAETDVANVGSYLWTPATTESTGGIVDMGIGSLADITEATAEGYTTSWGIATGHLACIRTKDGKYAKIEITSYEADANTTDVTFLWQYQPSGSRVF